jgi:Mg2+ and Co2+ transporter CorA
MPKNMQIPKEEEAGQEQLTPEQRIDRQIDELRDRISDMNFLLLSRAATDMAREYDDTADTLERQGSDEDAEYLRDSAERLRHLALNINGLNRRSLEDAMVETRREHLRLEEQAREGLLNMQVERITDMP